MKPAWAALLAWVVCGACSGQVCQQQWFPGWGIPGANHEVVALGTFDFDGSGPAPPELVAGGWFTLIGDAWGTGAARWNGQRWLPLGTNRVRVFGFATFDADGSGPEPARLFAAGQILDPATGLGGILRVLRWDGEEWEDMWPGIPFGARVLQTFDPDGSGPLGPRLIAAGWGSSSAPSNLRCIAQWDGASWMPLGAGISGYATSVPYVYSMTTFDPDGPGNAPERLIVAGMFQTAGSITANSIAAWDGVAWNSLDSGLRNPVGSPPGTSGQAMCVFDMDGPGPNPGRLLVGGDFQLAGDVHVQAIAQWDGARWSDVGGGVWNVGGTSPYAGYVYGLASFDEDGAGPVSPVLVVGGAFDHAGTLAARNLVSFDGERWSLAITQGLVSAAYSNSHEFPMTTVQPLGSAVPHLIVGGRVSLADGTPTPNIAMRAGTQWQGMWTGFDGGISAAASFDLDGPGPRGQEVVVFGGFTRTPDGPASRLARFDGSHWSGLPASPTYPVYVLKVLDPDGPGPRPPNLFMAGQGPISQWNGAGWTSMGGPPHDYVYDLEVFDFDGPGPENAGLVAAMMTLYVGEVWRQSGSTWTQVGADLVLQFPQQFDEASARALAVFDPDGLGPEAPRLVVGGRFDLEEGTTPPPARMDIAQWDGAHWVPVGPVNQFSDWGVSDLVTFDPDAAGPASALLVAANWGGVRAWNGSSWQGMGAGASRLLVFDPDGPGGLSDRLFSNGQGLCEWTGTMWACSGWPSALGAQSYPGDAGITTWKTSAMDAGQIVSFGGFFAAGGVSSAMFARMSCGTCYANCDGSVTSPRLTANDLVCFITRFAAGDAYANCDGSPGPPVLTASDFACFMNAFAAGCP